MSTPNPAQPPRDYSGVRRFFAGLMMAAGALLVLLCGACTVAIAIDDSSWAGVAIFVGMFGLVPGAGLIIIGRVLWRK